ncbi:hypothetical protein BC939DRAFT_434621 [Gamsiella multidivaricata]|uniref:uncharacterized protein n=1 Tax=Gamsiella multidivaricata TaxID=101098 RepID=UPI00221FF9EC|nr:uncharacterized protein BC939DRAFT_434621 [Gamsiella multidivaricata]KAI7832854.1 hypothetical protein BC939DRAFT_434621 [Gamsiella multidivaricata]
MQRVARLFLSMGIVQLAQPRTLGSVTSSCSRNSDQLRMVSAERYIHGKCGHGASTLAHHILFLFFLLLPSRLPFIQRVWVNSAEIPVAPSHHEDTQSFRCRGSPDCSFRWG